MIPRPARGTAKAERRRKRAALDREERETKAQVRRRDLRLCQVPKCYRRDVEVAHVKAKGMGGDHGTRTTTANLICVCAGHHRGPTISLHAGTLRVEARDPERGMNGPRDWFVKQGEHWVEFWIASLAERGGGF